jgi:hypothetical protein
VILDRGADLPEQCGAKSLNQCRHPSVVW